MLFSFFVYSFLGWVLEVIYAYTKEKRFVNRGFLNGPFVPIYGFGLITLHFLVHTIYDDFEPLRIGSIVIVFLLVTTVSTLIELFAGYMLNVLFETRWWDYSHLKYNFKGYVALRFSIAWGVIGTFSYTYMHHYVVIPFIEALDAQIVAILSTTLVIGMFIDWMLTVVSLLNFRRMLYELKGHLTNLRKKTEMLEDELESSRLDKLKSTLTTLLSNIRTNERLTKVKSKIDHLKAFFSAPKSEEPRREFESLRRLAEKISESRFYKAFPDIKLSLRNNNGKRDKEKNENNDIER